MPVTDHSDSPPHLMRTYLLQNMNLVFLGTVIALTLAATEGHSVRPNVTETGSKLCSYGYTYIPEKNECKPSCDDKQCIFGRCVSPGKCECLPDFHKKLTGDADTNYTCEPDKQFCKADCLTSECIENADCQCHNNETRRWIMSDSSECSCSKGKKVVEDDKPTCTCDFPCVNGKCLKPNECTCLPGFNKTVNPFECEPVCSYFNCTQDLCTVPHKCECSPGYTRKEPQHKNIVSEKSSNMAYCIKLPPNEKKHSETTKMLWKASELRPWFLVTAVVLLIAILFGSLAISFGCKKYRRHRDNAGIHEQVNRATPDHERGRNVSMTKDARSDFSVRYLHNEIHEEDNVHIST